MPQTEQMYHLPARPFVIKGSWPIHQTSAWGFFFPPCYCKRCPTFAQWKGVRIVEILYYIKQEQMYWPVLTIMETMHRGPSTILAYTVYYVLESVLSYSVCFSGTHCKCRVHTLGLLMDLAYISSLDRVYPVSLNTRYMISDAR